MVRTSSASRSRMARPPRNGLTGLSKLSKKMAGEALGFVFSIATLTSGQMPTGEDGVGGVGVVAVVVDV